MSKKRFTPVVAVLMVGIAASAMGCKASVKVGDAEPKAATPPAAPPPPAPPPAPAPEPPKIKSFGKATIVGHEIKIPGKINFEFDKAIIKHDAGTKDVLGTLLGVMKENPGITKLRIEGYTDNKGKPDYNKKLSQERADAVAKWLADNGIDKARVMSVGLGDERPVAPNDTDANREQNRRTEFKVWEMDGKPTAAAQNEPGAGAAGASHGAAAAAGGTPAAAGGAKPATPATPAKP